MRAAGPIVDPIPCSGCGTLLDPLRAGHVAIFDQKIHYFCNPRGCRTKFLAPFAQLSTPASPVPSRASRPSPMNGEAGPIRSALAPVIPEDVLPELPLLHDDRAFVEPIGRTIFDAPPSRADLAQEPPREVSPLLLLVAVIAGMLAVLLGLAGGGKLVLVARIMLAGVGAGMLVARTLTTHRDPSDPHPIPILAAPALSVAVAAWAALRAQTNLGGEAAALAGAIVMASAVGAWLVESARRFVLAERGWVERCLDVPGRRLNESGVDENETDDGAYDLRPGEKLVVEANEDVPVDLVINEGEVEVLPWLGATTPIRRRPGDPLVAGARVLRGRLVGTCTWAGHDRAFARLVVDPRRRVDALAPVARASRSLAERWAGIAALGCGVLTFAITRSYIESAMTAVAVLAGLATVVVGSLASVYVARGILLAQRRGITYKSADAWDRAARVNVALFCARGTLLRGEPEVAEVEPLAQNLDATDILSLATGGARAESHPVAQALLRAAKARAVKPDAVRNPNVYQGLGVAAVTSAGEELCVGTRALMLEQRISIATAEWRVGELEALGRSVVLVALSGRLVGLVALEDGIRPGARAAVQHLLDAQIEPVLMSGDSRETCEAIARSLDIEHIRPEVLLSERADEVKRIAETGASVAALGHPSLDDPALAAADVAIALGAAGSATGEHEVALAADEVRDAALSLALARRTRIEARVGFGLAAIPPALGSLVVAFGVLPPAFVPIAALIGGAMGVVHGRTIDRMRNPSEAMEG